MDKDQLYVLVQRYVRSISDPINKEYDKGYIDGVVDTLGDLISFLGMNELNDFADKMEQLQVLVYEGRVKELWQKDI